jgi:transposase
MKPVINPKKQRKYGAEFKAEALRLVSSGRRVAEVAAELGIGENLLYKWRSDGQSAQATVAVVANDEIDTLRRQIRQLEQERDILKKALLIFSQKT